MLRTSRAELAFTVYLELGAQRSLQRLHADLRADPGAYGFKRAPSLRTLETWSARDHWQNRIADLERQAQLQEEQDHVERIKAYRERLRSEGLLLQQKGLAWLSDKEVDDVRASDAIRAIAEGFRLEAMGIGEATDRVAIDVEHADVFDRLSDDELQRLIETLRADPGTGAAGTEPPPAG